jgi:tripeptide aminopeptidase
MGLTPELKAGSTDSNVPENRGVQALTIGGGGKGGSYHSLEEWFEPEGAYKGIQQILLMTLAFDQMKD